jgi:hypothetical protein
MPNTVTVSPADVSLFHVAARALGNPLQWHQIAALNGLTDPSLSGLTVPMVLILPAADPSQTTGLPVTSA